MDPLDLTKQPPRGPREQLGGLYVMARTVDKLRASLPGGNMGEYKIPGFSADLLERLGIQEERLRDVVASAKSDEDVARWLSENTDASRYADINREVSEESTEGYSERFHERYPMARRLGLRNLFDVLEHDDRESFGVPHPQHEASPAQ